MNLMMQMKPSLVEVMYNMTHIWKAQDGNYDVSKMKNQHIRDIILLLGKKQTDWLVREQQAKALGFAIGPYYIQDKPVQEWLVIFYEELHNRTGEKLKEIISWLHTWNPHEYNRTSNFCIKLH